MEITNEGLEVVQLVARHWVITDAAGDEEHVRGLGVVGEQPLLRPGETFQYTSFCPLATSLGSMHGSYAMRRPDGTVFDAEIGAFTLVDPATEN